MTMPAPVKVSPGRELRQQFPVYKDGGIPSEGYCELVRPAEKVGYGRRVPARTSRGPNATVIERPRDRFERGRASSSDCVDDRQKTGRELVGGSDLDLPTGLSRRRDVARVAERGTALLLGCQCCLCPFRDQLALFLRQGGVEVEHERILCRIGRISNIDQRVHHQDGRNI